MKTPADEKPDTAAPATAPAEPALTLFLRVVENDVEHDYDGGKLLLKPLRRQSDREIVDAGFVLSARTDAFLRRFPATRAEMQQRFYRLTLEEVPASALPPDPAVESKRKALEAQLAALSAEG